MRDLSVFDMTEDLSATKIIVEEEVTKIEPSVVGCGVEAHRKQVQVADLGNCAIQISVAIAEHDGEKDNELLEGDWEGVMVEDFNRLYKLLRSQYKESKSTTIQASIRYRNWRARLRASAIRLSRWRVKSNN